MAFQHNLVLIVVEQTRLVCRGRGTNVKSVVIKAIRMLQLISPADDLASESLVLTGVLDDIPRVIHVVKGVLAPLVIYEHRVLFARVKCSVGVLCWRPIVSRAHEGEPNRLPTRNEEQSNDCVVQMDSGICVALDGHVHAVPLVDIMEQVCCQRVGLGS